MAKFMMGEVVGVEPITARLGAGTGSSNNLTTAELGKIVKLVGESRYGLAAAGDQIEGFIVAVESATLDGYTIGSVKQKSYKQVTFDGLQATPGTGTVAIGDYVVTGTVVAKDTALSGPVKVTKATTQTGMYHAWRVVSLGSAGTGAVGTTGLIERVTA
ncbi:MAG: hypothetical protein KDH16_10950 [Rhodocyclaceae bacterium]|nr:hypothetical protein [Rhodocyclaceae bacterium]